MTEPAPAGIETWPGAHGFGRLAAILSDGENDALVASLRHLRGRSRAGARGLLQLAPVAALAADPRLLGPVRQSLGPAAVPFRATLFDKSLSSNWLVTWHQDTVLPLRERTAAAGWGPWSVKRGVLHAGAPAEALARVLALRVHLDESAADNGPLRVVPGSHRHGVLSGDEIARLVRAGPVVECTVPRGGVLAMSPLLVHASSKAWHPAPRRVLHLEYASRLELVPGCCLAVS